MLRSGVGRYDGFAIGVGASQCERGSRHKSDERSLGRRDLPAAGRAADDYADPGAERDADGYAGAGDRHDARADAGGDIEPIVANR